MVRYGLEVSVPILSMGVNCLTSQCLQRSVACIFACILLHVYLTANVWSTEIGGLIVVN